MADQTNSVALQREAINRGFSKQSAHYDHDDQINRVLQDLRHQVYAHVEKYLKPASRILELNAGTGLDALYFVSKNHRVHATDISDGMVSEIKRKIHDNKLAQELTCQQLSYTDLNHLEERDFDYVFSNFGGLNCLQDLSAVTRHLPPLLKDGAYLTMVIMPPFSLWELGWTLRGDLKKAFRRLRPNGTIAHVEGEYFRTWYHSLARIRKKLPHTFRLVASESLALVSPPPHRQEFPIKHHKLYNLLRTSDRLLGHLYPFNRCGDHIITTFQYRGKK